MENMRKYVAELIGTMLLVVFGCGSAVAADKLITEMALVAPAGFTTLVSAFAFGLIFIAMAFSIGQVSGCHLNPAVSLARFINGKLSNKDFIWYMVAQFAGAFIGGLLLWLMFGSREVLGTNGFGDASPLHITGGIALIIEIILTFVFVLVVLSVNSKDEKNSIGGVVMGLTLTLVHILGIPFTGTSVNPARSLGPAMVTGGAPLTQVWVFILAPVIGAIIAAFVHKYLTKNIEQ